MRLSNLRETPENIDEAPGGWIDQKIRSRIGTQASKKSADTRIQDREKGEKLYSKWLEVTGGGSDYSAAELASWLLKNVKIGGIKVDQNIIKKSFQEVNIPMPRLPRPPRTGAGGGSGTPPTPPSGNPPAPPTPPSGGGGNPPPAPTMKVKVPGGNASDADWQTWAANLAQRDPALHAKLAQAFGSGRRSRRSQGSGGGTP